MRLLNVIIAAVIILTLSGCNTTPDVKVTDTKPALNIPNPEPLFLKPVDWKIVTEETVEKTFETLYNNKIDPVIFGLTDIGYENLSYNMAEIKAYILKQRQIIQSYKDYYEKKSEKEKSKD